MAKNSMNDSLRKRMWPAVEERVLWMSTKRVGYAQIPRGLTIVNRILDSASTGKPVSSTYLALWCRLFDGAVVKIESQQAAAFEAGFSGPRALSTWKSRMKILEGLGFIQSASGSSGEYTYILMLDPYRRIMELKQKNELAVVEADYNSLLERVQKSDPSFESGSPSHFGALTPVEEFAEA